jgi:hypothetical protein
MAPPLLLAPVAPACADWPPLPPVPDDREQAAMAKAIAVRTANGVFIVISRQMFMVAGGSGTERSKFTPLVLSVPGHPNELRKLDKARGPVSETGSATSRSQDRTQVHGGLHGQGAISIHL